MADEELQPEAPEGEDAQEDTETHAIRRVREIVAQTQLIHHEPPAEKPEVVKKAKITWELDAWSPSRKVKARPLGMADMGGTQQARPKDGAKAKK